MARPHPPEAQLNLAEIAAELYGVSPEGFTAARDAQADALVRDQPTLADHVRNFGKPVRAAWALNQFVRHLPERVAQLADLAANLRQAHQNMDAAILRELTARRRNLIPQIVREIRAHLASTGPGLSEATATQVAETLMAMIGDLRVERAVLSGLLIRVLPAGDLSVTSIESATAIPGATGSAPEESRPGSPLVVVPSGAPTEPIVPSDRQVRAQQHRAAQRRVARLHSRVDRAHENRAQIQYATADLSQRLDRLRREQGELEQELAQSTRELQRAEQTHTKVRRSYEEALEELDRLQNHE